MLSVLLSVFLCDALDSACFHKKDSCPLSQTSVCIGLPTSPCSMAVVVRFGQDFGLVLLLHGAVRCGGGLLDS